MEERTAANPTTRDSTSKEGAKASSGRPLERDVQSFSDHFQKIESEIAKVIVGMEDTVRMTLASIFAGGHVLLEGAPGLGKTLLVKSIADVLGLSFNRIQFTSDLMPSDITGTQVLSENEEGKRSFQFKPGPVFANIVLADEVNRAGPKTQSSLLEAMEEKQVSVLGKTHRLPAPFFVLATQNPIELEGTYPLPEAQLDRFLLKLIVQPPNSSELKEILARTTGGTRVNVKPLLAREDSARAILAMRELVRKVVVAPPIQDVLVGMVFSLTPGSMSCSKLAGQYVTYGPGPRGAQAVLMVAKVFALLDGRINLSYEDINRAVVPALRHRLIMNYQAEAEGITTDEVIEEVRNAN